MPKISGYKFVRVSAKATEYSLICFKFGGGPFFEEKGFGTYCYIAGIVLGPNSMLLLDREDGVGEYATERAGYYGGDLAKAWEFILRNFERLNVFEKIVAERSKRGNWTVTRCDSPYRGILDLSPDGDTKSEEEVIE